MKKCAYCNNEEKLTKEHIFPHSFIRKSQKFDSAFLKAQTKVVNCEPQRKDVCSKCNNEHLSKLDNYSNKLYNEYFYKIVSQGDTIIFKYDYDLLLRWLLKISYNAARATDLNHSKIYLDYIPYILYGTPKPTHIYIFLQLIISKKLTKEEKIKLSTEFQDFNEITPKIFRVGDIMFHPFYISDFNIRRMASFYSYYFYLLAQPLAKMSRQSSRKFVRWFEKNVSNAKFIDPKNYSIQISSSHVNAVSIMEHQILSFNTVYKGCGSFPTT